MCYFNHDDRPVKGFTVHAGAGATILHAPLLAQAGETSRQPSEVARLVFAVGLHEPNLVSIEQTATAQALSRCLLGDDEALARSLAPYAFAFHALEARRGECLHAAVPGSTLVEIFERIDRLRVGVRVESFRRAPLDLLAARRGLTPSERDVVVLVIEGLTNKAIGDKLGRDEDTVEDQVSSILRKVGARKRQEISGFLAGAFWYGDVAPVQSLVHA